MLRQVREVIEQNTAPAPVDEAADTDPLRRLTWREKRSGRWALAVDVDPETKTILDSLLSPLSKPEPAGEFGPDARDVEQRRGDAFADVIRLAAAADAAPTEGGTRPHLTLTLNWNELRRLSGRVSLSGYGITSPEVARRLCCDSEVLPMVLRGDSLVMDVAHAKRTAPAWLRHILHERDRGCAFPHCDRPPKHTAPHHIVHWAHNGPTVLENLVLLCPRHHRLVHHSDWTCRMYDGIPEFVPPRWLDATQTPRRHNRHLLSTHIAPGAPEDPDEPE